MHMPGKRVATTAAVTVQHCNPWYYQRNQYTCKQNNLARCYY